MNRTKTRLLAAFLALAAALPCAARAQAIVATVNGDPVTTVDVAERAKVLHALGDKTSALESMIKSRVMATEINKFGIKVSSSDFAPTLQTLADRMHTTLEAVNARLQASGANKDHITNYLSIMTAFNLYARAHNRAVEVSSADIDKELAQDSKLARQTTYVIRQVLMTAEPSARAEAAREMQNLRNKFTSCDTGSKLTSEFPNLVVRPQVTRTTAQLGDQFAAMLDKTPIGHLTPSSIDSVGVAAVAVCERKTADKDGAREAAQQRILMRIVHRDADKLYDELRARAVIVKHRQ